MVKVLFTGLVYLVLLHVNVLVAQNNQNIELAVFENGSLEVHKVVEKSYNNFKFEQASKPWPIEFRKNGDEYTEIFIKRAGVIDELYTVDLPGCPAYFKNSSEIVITALDKKIYYYTYSVKTGSKINYILSQKSPGKYDDEKAKLDEYREKIKALQTNARNNRIDEKNAAEAKLLAENTLQDKSIKAIRVKLLGASDAIGMLSIVQVGFEVELDNGTILRTKNLGGHTPYTDFETNITGGEFAGGDIKVAADSRQIPGDKIEINVWSKYKTNTVKGTLSIPLNYKSDIAYQYQGASGASGRGRTVGYTEYGQDGKNGRSIRVTVNQKTINSTPVNHIVITDAGSGEVIAEAKLSTENTLCINVSGGNGGSGCNGNDCFSGNGANGGSGGQGGDIYLSGTGVSSLKLVTYTNGGKGGSGGTRKTASNTSGASGSNGSNGNVYK